MTSPTARSPLCDVALQSLATSVFAHTLTMTSAHHNAEHLTHLSQLVGRWTPRLFVGLVLWMLPSLQEGG